jgi:crotonobetainyl-CoA:carnitine CoA-transferase CaiB-like acyl-CoA transferase
VLAATFKRLETGQGQRVDTSLFEAGIVHTYWQSAIALATGRPPGPMGSAHPLNAPYQAFETADGWINVGAANQANWLRLLELLEAPELAQDARFSDNAARMAHLAELVAALTPHFQTHATAEWLDKLEAAGVPAGPVLSITEMHEDPQTLAREMVTEVAHSRIGAVKTLGLPIKLSETPGGVRQGAPVYGEHTREVLAEAGYTAGEIAALIEAGAVVAA